MFQTFEASTGPSHVADRVASLRASMAKAKLDAFLIPRADEHQGEYVPPSAERLQWLTGFTGSAGIAVVTRKSAALFIDGRYTVQAKAETDTTVFDVSLLPRPRLSEWLSDNLGKRAIVGFDPWLHTISEARRLSIALGAKGHALKAVSKNPIDKLWGKQRPAAPSGPVVVHPAEFSGRSIDEKIANIQKTLKADGQHAALLTLPDSICWALNIRGNDVAHNPVALAFAIVPASGKAELFIELEKIDAAVRRHLTGVAKISPPSALVERVSSLRKGAKRVRVDVDSAAAWFERALGFKTIAPGRDPCILPKAIKSAAEIAGARTAHIRDGVAIARYLCWLDEAAAGGKLDEITSVKHLEACRAETGALREISFATISGSGPHGAIVHYRVTDNTNRTLQPGELFLIDSGAQYQDGTTDITRTVAIGQPSDEMRQRFTAVLKGHIAIATARFPKGTRGIDLDPFARRALWDIGCDYDHGTGHGIGSYLSVHEGPQSISRGGMAMLEPGMLLSNEPGYYKEGAYGIRIENVVLVTDTAPIDAGDRPMMAFETLTLAPIDRRLIVAGQLTDSERAWLNAYHAEVEKTLAEQLDETTRRWLSAATAPL